MKNQEEVPVYNMYCLLLTGNGHEESGRSTPVKHLLFVIDR